MPTLIKDDNFTASDPLVSIACGDRHVAVLTRLGAVMCWGCSDYGQAGSNANQMVMSTSSSTVRVVLPPSTLRDETRTKVVSIACGVRQTYAMTSAGKILAWGRISCTTSSKDNPVYFTAKPITLGKGFLPPIHREMGPEERSRLKITACWGFGISAAFLGLKPVTRLETDEGGSAPADPLVRKMAETIHMDSDLCSMLLHPPTYSQQSAQHAHDMHVLKEAHGFVKQVSAGGRGPSPKGGANALSARFDAVSGPKGAKSKGSRGDDGDKNGKSAGGRRQSASLPPGGGRRSSSLRSGLPAGSPLAQFTNPSKNDNTPLGKQPEKQQRSRSRSPTGGLSGDGSPERATEANYHSTEVHISHNRHPHTAVSAG